MPSTATFCSRVSILSALRNPGRKRENATNRTAKTANTISCCPRRTRRFVPLVTPICLSLSSNWRKPVPFPALGPHRKSISTFLKLRHQLLPDRRSTARRAKTADRFANLRGIVRRGGTPFGREPRCPRKSPPSGIERRRYGTARDAGPQAFAGWRNSARHRRRVRGCRGVSRSRPAEPAIFVGIGDPRTCALKARSAKGWPSVLSSQSSTPDHLRLGRMEDQDFPIRKSPWQMRAASSGGRCSRQPFDQRFDVRQITPSRQFVLLGPAPDLALEIARGRRRSRQAQPDNGSTSCSFASVSAIPRIIAVLIPRSDASRIAAERG